MRSKRAAMLCVLILSCLPAAVSAQCTESRRACARGGLSSTVAEVRAVAENSADLTRAATAGPYVTEPSTGLLLLIGLGLIAGASLIAGKISNSDSVEDVENQGETAILARPASSPR